MISAPQSDFIHAYHIESTNKLEESINPVISRDEIKKEDVIIEQEFV